MHPADIKAALSKQGITQASLCTHLKSRSGLPISKGAVSRVISGALKSARIAQQISTATGLKVGQLWPGKYPEIEFLERAAAAAANKVAAAPQTKTKRSPAKRRAA